MLPERHMAKLRNEIKPYIPKRSRAIMKRHELTNEILKLTGHKRSLHPDVTFGIFRLLNKYEREKRMKAYYARPITHYNTEEDQKTIDLLHDMGLEVEDPNQEKYQKGYKEKGMRVFLDAIDECDVVFYKTFSHGFISAGVYKEIRYAKSQHIPVFNVVDIITQKPLTVKQTREAIKQGLV